MDSVIPFDHLAFLRLSDDDKELLWSAAELWEAPEGARIYHPGDSGEDLLLLLTGRLEFNENGMVASRRLVGELWGEDRLVHPRPVAGALVAAEDSRWLRWSRDTLLNLYSRPSIRRALLPCRDKSGRLLSGFAEVLPVISPVSRAGRRLRPSSKPALIGFIISVIGAGLLVLALRSNTNLPPIFPLVSPAIYLGWLITFFIQRLFSEYGIEDDVVSSRNLDWSRFAVESRQVPVDRIQGVEVETPDLIRRIFRIGTVYVKTSAMGGELVFRDVDRPDKLAKEIQDLQNIKAVRSTSREREMIRRLLEEQTPYEGVPRRVWLMPKSGREMSNIPGDTRFRKSIAVLMGSLLFPLLITVSLLLIADFIAGYLSVSSNVVMITAVIPFFWALYRFEDWRNDQFQVSGGYVVDLYRKPLGMKETRRQVELLSIQNIRTEQKGLAAFLFRYGNVILVTAGGASDTVFKNVSRPWRVQEILFARREDKMRRQEAARQAERKNDFTRFAEVMNQLKTLEDKP